MDSLPYDREAKYEDPRIVARYDRRYADRAGRWNNALVLRALDRALGPAGFGGRMVLDVPFGTGRLSEWIARRGGRSIGCDRSFPMLLAGGTRAREHEVRRLHANAFSLPFPDRCPALGAAVSARFTHLLTSEERVAFLRELARILTGPALVLYYPNHTIKAASRWARRRLGFAASDRTPWIPWRTIEDEIARSGFRLERRVPVWRGFVSAHVLRLSPEREGSVRFGR